MDIKIEGKLYIYFIKKIFELNKIIGIEMIIDIKKSDNSLIRELNRIKCIDNNIIYIKNNNNLLHKLDTSIQKYTANITFNYNDNNNDTNKLSVNKVDILEIDKVDEPIKNIKKSIYINKYNNSSYNIAKQIRDILN